MSEQKQKTVKGYKVFNPDWTCRGFQYEVGKCYETDEKPVVCKEGFHFCEKLVDCYDYYKFNDKNKVAEITAYGDIDIDHDQYGKKCCTNKIKIEKELKRHEVLAMVNIGENCTGIKNTGNNNSGDYNDGNYNSGDYNIGDYNSGHYNIGHYNSGNDNIGHYNSGDYNTSNFNNGCFNTKTIKIKMFLFNQLSNWTLKDWYNSEAKRILDGYVSVSPVEKTKEEIFEQQQQNWNQLSKKQKNIVMAIPNFDKEIFKQITGIDVDKGVMKHEKDC